MTIKQKIIQCGLSQRELLKLCGEVGGLEDAPFYDHADSQLRRDDVEGWRNQK